MLSFVNFEDWLAEPNQVESPIALAPQPKDPELADYLNNLVEPSGLDSLLDLPNQEGTNSEQRAPTEFEGWASTGGGLSVDVPLPEQHASLAQPSVFEFSTGGQYELSSELPLPSNANYISTTPEQDNRVVDPSDLELFKDPTDPNLHLLSDHTLPSEVLRPEDLGEGIQPEPTTFESPNWEDSTGDEFEELLNWVMSAREISSNCI